MICKNCGARIADNAGFCGKCGAKTASGQPSREEIRARVQGGGRQAATTRTAAPARRAAPAGGAMPLGLDKSRLFVLAAALLSLLQIVYLFVKSVFITISYGGESVSDGASMFSVLKEGNATFLAVLLLLLCLALVASIAVPVLLRRGQKPIVTIVIAALTLLLFIISDVAINKFFDTYNLGVKPHLGLAGWLFILNCLAIPALIFLAGRGEEPVPARAAARQPAARRPAPAARPAVQRQAPPRRGVNGFSRPSAPAQHVSPPDAETIAALRRMAEMHRQGLVSDEEFARIKAECVARGWIRE